MALRIFLIFCIAGIAFLLFVLVSLMHESKRHQRETQILTRRTSREVGKKFVGQNNSASRSTRGGPDKVPSSPA